MEIRNDFQKNDDNAPKLVESKKMQPAITGPIKVLFLDNCKPLNPLFSNIHLFAKYFVANKMQAPFYTLIKYGTPMECVKSNGSYATYFSIPECNNEEDVKKVVSAINDADVVVCGRLSGPVVLGFGFKLNTDLGPFAEAIAERVSNGFKNVIRYNSEDDLSNCLECFKELPPMVERGQNAYGKIFELIKQMQPKRNFIQNHKTETSVFAFLALLGLGCKFSEKNNSPENSHSSHLKLK